MLTIIVFAFIFATSLNWFESSCFVSVASSDSSSSYDNKKDDTQQDVDDAMLEELKNDDLKNYGDEQDKGLIVEADAEAIDEAIKKHSKDDDAIVEADEQTIIDKVLSQKKKGRWSRK